MYSTAYFSKWEDICHIEIYLVLFLLFILVLCKSNAPLSFGEPLLKQVFTPFYASMHWTIEAPVRASSKGQAVQREGRFRLTFSSTILIQILLLYIALFSLF